MPPLNNSGKPVNKPETSANQNFFSRNISLLCKNITSIAQHSLRILSEGLKTVAFNVVLILGKVVAVTFLSSLLVGAVTLTALSTITLIGGSYTLKENQNPRLFHYMASICLELRSIIGITLEYQVPHNNEVLQTADDQEGSPEFIVVHPTLASTEEKKSVPPIVYAPGYLDEPETLRSTCRELAERTGSSIYIVKYRSRFQSIHEHAKDFNRVVDRALADQDQSELFIAGHSMGGLVTGTYLTEHKKPDTHVKKWITVASPLKGTPVAYLGLGKCAEQMRPSSEFMRVFHEEDKQNILSATPSFHIYTKTDLIVPYMSSKKMQPVAQEKMSTLPYGHLSVRSCPEMMQATSEAILGAS